MYHTFITKVKLKSAQNALQVFNVNSVPLNNGRFVISRNILKLFFSITMVLSRQVNLVEEYREGF